EEAEDVVPEDLVVGEVAVVVAQRPRRGVGRDDRPGGDLQDVGDTGRSRNTNGRTAAASGPRRVPSRRGPGPGLPSIGRQPGVQRWLSPAQPEEIWIGVPLPLPAASRQRPDRTP